MSNQAPIARYYPPGSIYYRKERLEREAARNTAIGLLLIFMAVVALGAVIGW